MFRVLPPQERAGSRLRVLAMALIGALAVGAPAFAQDHVHDLSATVLPHNIPDFCAVPGAVMTARSGAWTDPLTWSNGAVPGPTDVRVIAPGHNVTIASTAPAVRVLCVEGSLAFKTDANTKLTVGTMLVKPTGSLEMGSASAPVSAANTAEIVIANTPLNDPLISGYDATGFDGNWVADPEQYGTGIISLGRTTFRGAAKSPTWARVTVEPRAGTRTLTLESPVTGWRAGDRLILPDTRHLMVSEVGDGTTLSSWTRRQGEWEELTIASVSGNVVILTAPLRFDHFGARNADNQLVLLPHVGNLSRNVIVRSANPIGSGVQGHLLFTSRAEVDIRHSAFRDLGRTKAIPCAVDANNNQLSPACSNGIEPHVNQIGRYPIHFHHLIGPISTPADGHQFTFSGNAIDGGSAQHTRRWSVAIHASHYGLISENVAYNYAGALFNTEDGTESYNVIENNFAVRSAGTGGRLGFGNEGMGFWFRGPNNYVRGNVAADFDSDNVEAAYGYKYFMHGNCVGCDSLASIKIPTAPGQDPLDYKTVSGNSLPILQFENNEVYSAAEGLTYWWLSSSDPIPAPNPKPSVFKDLRIWHVYNIGIYHYPGARVLFDGLQIYGDVFRADRPDFYACCGRGFHGEDYAATDIRIINSKIHNMWSPFIPSAAGTGRQIIENTELKNTMWSDVGVDTMFSANGPDWLPSRKIILNNVKFRGTEVASGGSGVTISKEWFERATSNLFQADQLLVYGYQGSSTDNFEIFYDVQGPGSLFAGGPAPCNTTRAAIQGLVCQTDASRGPVITWLDPWEGATAGGTIVKISGANFRADSQVTFDGVAAQIRTAQPNSLEVRVPAHAPGSVAVKVENPGGLSDELPANYEAEGDAGALIRVPIGFTFSSDVAPPPPVNTAPIAVGDSYVTTEDAPLTVSGPGVLGNDSDADGNPLTAVLVSGTLNGTLTLNGDGSFTYTPNPLFSGADSFSYKANDGTDDSNVGTVNLIVNAVNHAPVAVDDAVSMQEDGAEVTINALLNDTDIDGDTLSSTVAGGPSHGALRVGGEGRQYFYRPDPNFCGNDFFDYLLTDGRGGSDTGRVTITVNCVNDAPTARDDSFEVPEDSPETRLDVLANDNAANVDVDELLFVASCNPVSPASGRVTVAADKSAVFFTPAPNFSGVVSFTCLIGDAGHPGGANGAVSSTVTIAVTAVNDAPVANDQSVTTDEDVAKAITLSATDADSTVLTYTIVSIPAHGKVALNGAVATYTPDANFSGPDSFAFRANDGAADSNIATVSITVNAVNDAPIANAQSVSTGEDTPTAIVLVASDVDNPALTYAVTAPGHGTLSGTAPNLTYTPNADYFGPDSFTFTASDGTLTSAPATVSITVNAVNDAPVAVDQAVTTDEDTAASITLGATDVDSDTLSFTIVSQPANGRLTISGASVIYTPALNFSGPDSFTFKANDGTIDSNVATVSIAVTAVNDAPVAASQSVSTDEDVAAAIILAATDVEGSALTFTIVSGPAHGTLSGAAPNLTYTPAANFSGSDSFTFTANDGAADSNVATVSIAINPVNDTPVAVADSYSVDEDQVLTVAAPGLLGNDSDVDAGTTLTAMIVGQPAHGTLMLNADGSFSYTPAPDFSGGDVFTYKANDGTVDSNVVTVTITVNAMNDAPVAQNATASTDEDAPVSFSLLATDEDGGSLTYAIVAGPQHGTLTIAGNLATYTPAANFNGADSFTFKANDGAVDSNIATVTIAVNPVNDAPVALADTYETSEDQALSVAAPGILGNDTDLEGDALSARIATGVANGTLSLNLDGSFTYTPIAGFSGTDGFTYVARDGSLDSNVVAVTILVAAVNDAPVANDQLLVTNEDTPLSITLTASDGDSALLTFEVLSQPQHGALSVAGPNVIYTPADNYYGSDSFTFKANDGSLDSNVATIAITVAPVNDAPVAAADSYAADQNLPLTIAAPGVLANDSDIDGPALTAIIEGQPAHGTVALNDDGGFTYVPAAGFTGADSFTYRASDGTLSSEPATVSIVVFADRVSTDAAPREVVSTDNDGAAGATPQDPVETSVTLAGQPGAVSIGETAVTQAAPQGYTFFNYQVRITAPAASAADPLLVTFTLDASIVPAGQNAATLAVFRNGVLVANCDASAGSAASPDPCVAGRMLLDDGDVQLAIRTSAASDWNFAVSNENAAPVATNDEYHTDEETPLTVAAPGVLGNDADADGNTLTAELVDGATHGTVTLLPSGGFTYTPNADFAGTDSFTYRAHDGRERSNLATVTITVEGVNDAPSAVDDSASTTEGGPIDIPVVANDVDPDGENAGLRVVVGSIASVRGGAATLLADGRTVRFTPAAGANDGNTPGGFGFTYRVTDGGATSANEGVVTVTVSAVNDAPHANDDAYTTAEDTALEIAAPGVLENDTDADGDSLSAVLVSGPAHGTLTLDADGSFRYAPAANYNGADSFVYKATDGSLESQAMVSISVTAVNDAPVSVADSYETNEDTVFNVPAAGVLGNDTDADDDGLTASLVTGPTHGTLTLNANGSFSYTPAANYHGGDSFTYKASDGTVDSAVATVTISIASVNDAPVARDNAYGVNEDTELVVGAPGVRGNDTDEDGDNLTVILVSGPAHGTLDLNADGTFRYMPAPDFNGRDTFTYKVNDGTVDSNAAPVVIDVAPVNDAPVAVGDAFAAVEDQPLVIGAPGVLGNDTDRDGDALSVIPVSGPAHGSLALNADGSFTYTPAANVSGPDSFTYRVSDGSLTSEPATVSIGVEAANDAPVAMNDAYQVVEDGTLTVAAPGVLANDTDIDGDLLTATLMTAPEHGSIVLGIDGGFIYTPQANFNGADLFIYSAVDAAGNASLATVQILVTAVNDAPAAAADAYSVAEDGQLDVDAEHGVLSNDTDVEHESLTAVLVGQASHGMVTLNEDGSFSYVPAVNFTGTDTFSYKANDGQADSDAVDVTITVDTVNDAPAALGDSYSVDEDATLTIAAPGVLGNDSDTDGDTLAAVVLSQPQHGSLTLNGDGSFSYKPAADYNGSDAFSYKANDGNADSNVAEVTIAVRAINDAPVAATQSVATAEDTPLAIALGATDVDGDTLTYSVVSGPAHGTLSGSAPDLTYTPAANYSGPDAFTFKANDGSLDSNVATVSIAVGSANDAPAASNDSYTVVEDGTLAIDAPGVLANDSDADGNPLTVVLLAGPAHGTLALSPNGAFTYRPAANFAGADSFSYRANDGTLDSNGATVSITVTAGEDAPVANDDNYSVAEDATLTVDAPGVLGNDTDSDSTALTVALVGSTSNGTLTLNADGSFTYTPAANFNGSDSFTYRASDGANSSTLATVTINVSAVNDPPVITPVLNQGAVVGKPVSLQIVAEDVDSPALQYSATGLPSGLVLDAATGGIAGTPTMAATYTVTVTVSDGAAATTAVFTWTVLPEKVIIAKPSDQRSFERDHVELHIETTLPERKGKDRRVFAATGLPPGLSIDKDGVIDGRLKNASAGVYDVTVTVTLGNTSGSAQFTWTVIDVVKSRGRDGRSPEQWLDDRDDRHDNEQRSDRGGI
jgi:large repetitive protein